MSSGRDLVKFFRILGFLHSLITLQTLAQDLGGLQNAAKTQFSLLEQSDSSDPYLSQYPELQTNYSSALSTISEEIETNMLESPVDMRQSEEPILAIVTGRTLFDQFIHHLGPSMVCKNIVILMSNI